jgi:hypothetical protein
MANSIKLPNGDKIAVASIVEVTEDFGYSLKVGDQLEVKTWYPYYGRTKVYLLKNDEGYDHCLSGLKTIKF